MKKYDLAVFIGRFEPLTLGHEKVIQEALKQADAVAILIGSAGGNRSHRNPWLYSERQEMLRKAFPEAIAQHRIKMYPVEDSAYNDGAWVLDVQNTVAQSVKDLGLKDPKIALVGHNKDNSSFYLKLFPQWDSIEVENVRSINATAVREKLFSTSLVTENGLFKDMLSPGIIDYVTEFSKSTAYSDMVKEYEFVADYKNNVGVVDTSLVPAELQDQLATVLPFLKAKLKWPPIYTTTDAVVVQSGHILLIQRGHFPGKGLWALPGGFLNPNERIVDGVIRELKEETRIKVPVPVLKGSIVAQKVFDDPYRSSRGRTITHSFLFNLNSDHELPKVKAGSAASDQIGPETLGCKWVPLSEVTREMMFEDHYAIITNLTALL